MINPIYTPKGRAGEYADLALNIYTGCNHGCTYCFSKKNFDRWHPNENFADVKPREGIVEATKKQLSKGKHKGKTIMLCFTCDPYPTLIDTMPTRDIIMAIKEAGAHVQILTKGGDRARRDFDLLDSGDSFGITLSCLSADISLKAEPNAGNPLERLNSLIDASRKGINTWVSFEPVIEPVEVLELIYNLPVMVNKDTLLKIGKMNHHKSDIDWKKFGLVAECICKENGWNYYIKEDLRSKMEAKP